MLVQVLRGEKGRIFVQEVADGGVAKGLTMGKLEVTKQLQCLLVFDLHFFEMVHCKQHRRLYLFKISHTQLVILDFQPELFDDFKRIRVFLYGYEHGHVINKKSSLCTENVVLGYSL